MALKKLKKKGLKKKGGKKSKKDEAPKAVKGQKAPKVRKGKKGGNSTKAPKPAAQTEKSKKFHELMTGKPDSPNDTGRMGKMLDRMKLIRNLSNTNNYDFTADEAAQVVAAVREQADLLEADFDPDQKTTVIETTSFAFD